MTDTLASAVPVGDAGGDASSGSSRRAEDQKADGDGGRGQDKDDEYLMTLSHCYVSRSAALEDASNVEFKGRAVVERDCTLRGDCGIIKVGRYVWLHPGTTLQPGTTASTNSKSVPMVIGSHTTVDRDCHIRAAAIGSYCWIGRRVRLGQRVIVKDCCVILDDVVLGDDTVIPPFTLVHSTTTTTTVPHPAQSALKNEAAAATRTELREALPAWSRAPAYWCAELPPSTATEMQERSIEQYATFAAAVASQGKGASSQQG
jgi:carbonic anhydrase/acetyltransferase-like protein (isoleucine patch superfamily)